MGIRLFWPFFKSTEWFNFAMFYSEKCNLSLTIVHGLRTPRESFFFKSFELLGMGRHFVLKFFEAFGVFSAGLSAPILVLHIGLKAIICGTLTILWFGPNYVPFFSFSLQSTYFNNHFFSQICRCPKLVFI